MQELDLSKMFDSMSVAVDSGNNPIKAIYDIIPTLDPTQQRMLFSLQFFIDKWHLDHLQDMINNYQAVLYNNKNLGFFGSKSLRDLLSAYSQSDLIRGINIRSKESVDDMRIGGT